MKKFNQVLEDMQLTPEQREQSHGLLPTLPLGSTKADGSLITQSPNQSQQGARPMTGQWQSPEASNPSTIPTTLSAGLGGKGNNPQPSTGLSEEDRFNLGRFVWDCFNSLDTYGKTPDQLESAAKTFIAVLSQYPMDSIVQAFSQWVLRNSKMPTPSDIANIIDPPAPKPDWPRYIRIQGVLQARAKGSDIFLSDHDRAYIRYCDDYSKTELSEYQNLQETKQAISESETKARY